MVQTMGDQGFVHPTAEIESGAVIGQRTAVWRHTHIRSSARIGSDCVIGAHVYVDVEVVIGDRVKVENQAAIFGPASLGDGCFVGPGACLSNDRHPRAVTPEGALKRSSDWEALGVSMGEGASVGAMATLIAGTRIGDWAVVGAGAVVVGDVAPYVLVVGVPARPIGHVCRCGLRLDDRCRCSCGRTYEAVAGEITPTSS